MIKLDFSIQFTLANVLQFAKKLQKRKDKKPLFIVKTSGEPLALNNISSLKVKSILRKRGLILENEYHYCMPYNIIFRHTDNMAYKMWESAKSIIPYDCDEIIAGEKRKLKYIPCGRMLAWIFRIEHWAGRFNGKKYKVNENCIKCGMCVRNCPTHNITMENGNFKFGKNCLMCMRCSFNCPKNCIKIGLFENWKVNGRYSFTPNKNQVETHKNYCKRSYKKYFSKIENRLNSIDAKSNTQ